VSLGVGNDHVGGVACHQDTAAAVVRGANGVEYLESIEIERFGTRRSCDNGLPNIDARAKLNG
jgi:hypothetical protein